MSNFFSKKDLLDYVDSSNFLIYDDEYETISFLLDNLDGVIFTRILEEVAYGGLSFSDFISVLKTSNYSNILRENFSIEEKILSLLNSFKEFRLKRESLEDFKKENQIALTSELISDDKQEEFIQRVREEKNELIFSLFDNFDACSEIEKEARLSMIKYLKNYSIEYEESAQEVLDKILFFVNSGFISFDSEKIIITQSDKEFMLQNSLSLDELKKIKATFNFISKKEFV